MINEQDKNNLFYVCTLIEYLGRKTKNTRSDIVKVLGKKEIVRQLELADVNHCLPLDQVADELIFEYKIKDGGYDSVGNCHYTIPSLSGIAKNYQRLILDVMKDGQKMVDVLFDVFNSFISDEISNFNSSVFYSSPEYLKLSYEEGRLLL